MGYESIFDITFIGGGPVGLYGAFYAGLRGMRVKIIDALGQLGGQLAALYPEKYLLDIPGFPKITAKELVANLTDQALQFRPTVCLNQNIQTLARDESLGCWRLATSGDGLSGSVVHWSKTVVLCVGAGAFQPKKIPINGAEKYEGPAGGLHYYVPDKSIFTGKKLLIIGGGDSAIDWALNLEPLAQEVTLIHRRNGFRAHEENVKRVLGSRVKVLTFHELAEILPAHDSAHQAIAGAVITNTGPGVVEGERSKKIVVDAILAQLGFVSSLGMLRNWPVTTQGAAIAVDSQMRTNLPGLFAAGDIATYPGKIKLIATGFGEAAVAANTAKTMLDPKAKLFPGHSSEMISHQPLTTLP